MVNKYSITKDQYQLIIELVKKSGTYDWIETLSNMTVYTFLNHECCPWWCIFFAQNIKGINKIKGVNKKLLLNIAMERIYDMNDYGLTQGLLNHIINTHNSIVRKRPDRLHMETLYHGIDHMYISNYTVNEFLTHSRCAERCYEMSFDTVHYTKMFKKIIIDKDKSGKYCYLLAKNNSNISLEDEELLFRIAKDRGYVHGK